LFRIIQHTN